MIKSAARPTDDEITRTVQDYTNILFKLCFTILCHSADAEDAVSETFIKYMTKSPLFKDEEHKKAWLIKVASNICKDKKRFRIKHSYTDLDDIREFCKDEHDTGILETLLSLPDKYKAVIHLFYIEGYKTDEISKILAISPAAVRKRLQYGRQLLKLEYGKDDQI